jgi:arylsulfatase A-like enzyme
MVSHPNIVFIHVDQWRADCLSIDGHPVVHTPTLDKMALNGVRFSRAYASCPTCIPSRASLLTGLAPEHHGRVGYQDGIPWNYPTSLAGEFTQNGYRTHAIGKMHVYPERNTFGFESVELHDGFLHFARDRTHHPIQEDDYLDWLRKETGRADADYFEHGVNCNSMVARPWDKEERLHPTNWVASRGIDFLRTRLAQKEERPFFLYLSFHRPHPPYDPPAWAFERYLHMEMPPVPVGNWVDLFAEHDATPHPEAFRARYRPDILQRARAGYYGHMSHIDLQLNRFEETLHECGLRGNTWIVFTSDHGEMMGDHHFFRKGYPYEGSARVPLILQPPAGTNIPRGQIRDTVVEMRDFLPTLLECAGLPSAAGIDGLSFLPQARGESREALRPWLHGEHTLLGGAIHWITDGQEKYIWHSKNGLEQLFHLGQDPAELHDLAIHPTSRNAARLALWRKVLADDLKNREEGFVADDGSLIAGRPVKPTLDCLFRG